MVTEARRGGYDPMARTWLSICVDLVEGHGEHLWPRPGRIFAAARSHAFAQLGRAIDDAFARWDRAISTSSASASCRLATRISRSGSSMPASWRSPSAWPSRRSRRSTSAILERCGQPMWRPLSSGRERIGHGPWWHAGAATSREARAPAPIEVEAGSVRQPSSGPVVVEFSAPTSPDSLTHLG